MRVHAMLLAPILAAAIGGCNPETACDCGPVGATITVSGARAHAVTQAHVEGPCWIACEEDGSCDVLRVEATDEGTCHVEISFCGGAPYEADIEFTFIEGDCCYGYYTTHDRDLRVPPSSADAGSDSNDPDPDEPDASEGRPGALDRSAGRDSS